MRQVTNRHEGKPFIICGTAPFVPTLPPQLVQDAIIIGVNNYPVMRSINAIPKGPVADYLVVVDTRHIPARMPLALKFAFCENLNAEVFLSADIDGAYEAVQNDLMFKAHQESVHFFKRPDGFVKNDGMTLSAKAKFPTSWLPDEEPEEVCGLLGHVCTVATAAANLALVMGASEIILYRVDLTGATRFGDAIAPWKQFEPAVSAFFNSLPVKVSKTNPESPLRVPLYV